MYARWKTYQRKGRERYKHGVGYVRDSEMVHTAVLVETRRVDGKPRQRVIRYLGSVRESERERAWCRLRIWQAVDAAIVELGLGIFPEQCAAIEERIAQIVSQPTPEELSADRARLESLEATISNRARANTSP